MSNFFEIMNYLQQELYSPNQLIVSQVLAEPHNKKYAGGSYYLNETSVRFRQAKVTPKKSGQFVAFWEKGREGRNQPYLASDSPDLLVIYLMADERQGTFVFPHELLVQKRIITVGNLQGKMGMRVYPPWDQPTSRQASETQKWQRPYFMDFSEGSKVTLGQLRASYHLS